MISMHPVTVRVWTTVALRMRLGLLFPMPFLHTFV